MEREPRKQKEAKDGKPERSIEAPAIVWWLLAILAIAGFTALAVILGR